VLRVLLGDPPIARDRVKTRTDYQKYFTFRQSRPAAVVIRDVLTRGRKALMMYGALHLQRRKAAKESVVKWFLRGAIVGVVGTFPLAALCALLFRFPIPFDAYRSGLDAVVPALFAVVFYGMLGGFVVQAALGGLGGLIASQRSPGQPSDVGRRCLVFSLAGASVGVVALAVLDRIIGPW
jgi:hypothetical protein